MALVQIPVNFNAPDFEFQIDLDGVVYGFRFTLNERTDRYSMTVSTEAGDVIVAGVAVVTNWKILERFKDERLPPGEIFTMDTTGGTDEPSPANFGSTILLCYNEVEE